MSVKIKRIVGAVVFMSLVFFVIYTVQDLVTPNYDWPDHNRRSRKSLGSAFNEPENSIDVIYLGTSQTFCSISPMDIYNNGHIRSYNMATTNQRVPVAYYLLKAILHRQKPKLVLLDASGIYYTEDEIKSPAKWEEMTDSLPMIYFQEKLGMMREIAKLRERKGDVKYVVSALIPLLRYHSNYFLQKKDYQQLYLKDLYQRKGYVATYDFIPVEETNYRTAMAMLDPEDTFADDDDLKDRMADCIEANESYIRGMKQMCEEIGAELAFIKVPVCTTTEHRGYWSANKHDVTQALADKLGMKFWDMCYEDLGIDWQHDTSDGGSHVNYRGTQKTSAKLLEWMQDTFGLVSEPDETLDYQWSYQSNLFAEEVEYLNLESEYDLLNYLERVQKDDYVLFTAVSNRIGKYWSDDAQKRFEAATGTTLDLRNKENAAYLCVSSRGEVIDEGYDEKSCNAESTLENGLTYKLSSRAGMGKRNSSIVIDGREYSAEGAGIHFVVYDRKLNCVVDSVCFDTTKPTLQGVQNTDYKETMREHVIKYVHGVMKQM